MVWNAMHDSRAQWCWKDPMNGIIGIVCPGEILAGITGIVCAREILAMLRPFGSGKTTLLSALGEGFYAKILAKENLPIYLDIKLILQTLTPTKLPTTQNILNKNLLSILPTIKNPMLFINNEILCWLLKEMTGIRAQKAEKLIPWCAIADKFLAKTIVW